jgi:hypothetical protein
MMIVLGIWMLGYSQGRAAGRVEATLDFARRLITERSARGASSS